MLILFASRAVVYFDTEITLYPQEAVLYKGFPLIVTTSVVVAELHSSYVTVFHCGSAFLAVLQKSREV